MKECLKGYGEKVKFGIWSWESGDLNFWFLIFDLFAPNSELIT